MTGPSEQPEVQVGPVVKVARDLREIERLFTALMVQAIHKANARIDGTSLPGGYAMVALASVGSPEAWGENIAAAEFRHLAACRRLDHTRCRYAEHVADEDGDEPILQTLLFWSESWRNYDIERTPTVATEANYIRGRLDWAWDNLVEWADFAKDIRHARLRLEDLLFAGRRDERTLVTCDREPCDRKPRLIKLYGDDPTGGMDKWKCPGCKASFTDDDFGRAHATMLRSASAERWVRQTEAIWILRDQGRPERTARDWLSQGEGSAYCDPVTHEVWTWWPDLWRRHLQTPTRNRAERADTAV